MKGLGGISGLLLGAYLFSITACSTEVINQDPMVNKKALVGVSEIKIADLNEALNLDQNNAGLYAKRAKLYLQDKKLEKALADIEQAIKFNSNQPEYYFWKAVILRDMGHITQALEVVEEAEKLGLKGANGYLLGAELLIKKKNYWSALEKVNLALNEEPDNEYGLFYKGIARAALGDTASALVLYRRAIRNAPDFVHPYLHVSSIYNAQKNYPEAEVHLKKGKALEPTNAFLWYQQGLRYKGLKRQDSAYFSFTQAHKLDADSYLANYQLALIDYKKGNFASVVTHLEKIATRLNNLDQAQEMLAESYEKTGRYQDALAAYNLVLQRKPNDVKSMWGVRRSAWGLRKMQRDSLRRTRNYNIMPDIIMPDVIVQDTVY
ncbi:tetratricopeptide repeat protein [Adhaeribacter rhizoryzae]|uniref:Tetratricopeptide repeat protein n=1 Tax=Adhaeribacter rhizoryzae TaxID=2607907 RepID=A0A5M6DJJ1_9BACT|nr:tetratricopeptide repeat protein [Adhaeribacter rhizoryzae]KAA5547714.1 tetratricopeptide repeat protein [Adhaeribacter rhizoryzae]